MKTFLAIFGILMIFFSTFVPAEVSLNFSIDNKVYDNLDEIQKNNLINRVSELKTFFNENILKKIPANIIQDIQNLKVTILLSDKNERDGLFVPNESNHQHKIIVKLNQINSLGFTSLLAHEFFHAVHYEINPGELPWIREGMAQLFEYIVTNELNGMNLKAAIDSPLTPLIGEYEIETSNAAQYGHDMLYFLYLFNHCGNSSLFWEIANGASGVKGNRLIDLVLTKKNSKNVACQSFMNSAISFEVAKNHNQFQFNNTGDPERFFLAPTNLNSKKSTFNSPEDLGDIINQMPFLSSMKLDLVTWLKLNGQCADCAIFYARRSFPYEVLNELPSEQKNKFDVIVVKDSLGIISTADRSQLKKYK